MSGIFSSPNVQQMPEPTVIKTPVVNQETVDRNTSNMFRRRRGSATTVLTSSAGPETGGSVAGKTLLGQ